MKSPWWMGFILAPATIICLAYLVFIPNKTTLVNLDHYIFILMIDAINQSVFTELIQSNELPNFTRLINEGCLGNLVRPTAHDIPQAWIEIMTGKDVRRYHTSGVTYDCRNYSFTITRPGIENSYADVIQIFNWYGKKCSFTENLNDFDIDTIKRNNLNVMFIKNEYSEDKAYLEVCDSVLGRILQQSVYKPCIFVVCPLSKTSKVSLFYVNRWLESIGLLKRNEQGIDWQQTKAFSWRSSEMGIRLHQKDLYKNGIVSPDETSYLKKFILKKLREQDLRINEDPVFHQILDGSILHSQRSPGQYPDITLSFNLFEQPILLNTSLTVNTFPSVTPSSEFFQTNRNLNRQYITSGTGWIILHGTPFLENMKLRELLNMDVTPTVLFLNGIPKGRDMPGRVIVTGLKSKWLKIPRSAVPSHERINPRVNQEDLMN